MSNILRKYMSTSANTPESTGERVDDDQFSLPDRVGFLTDNQKAVVLVESIRWRSGHYCPRCASKFVKRVNTNVFRDLHRCIDCGYMFNSLSGTIFQGSKIQIVRFFQLLALENALKQNLGVREVCFAIDVSHKTAVSLIRRIQTVQPKVDFAVSSKSIYSKISTSQAGTSPELNPAYRNFLAYCEMNSVVVREDKFAEYLESFL